MKFFDPRSMDEKYPEMHNRSKFDQEQMAKKLEELKNFPRDKSSPLKARAKRPLNITIEELPDDEAHVSPPPPGVK